MQSVSERAGCPEDNIKLSGSPGLHKPCWSGVVKVVVGGVGRRKWERRGGCEQRKNQSLVTAIGSAKFFQLATFANLDETSGVER